MRRPCPEEWRWESSHISTVNIPCFMLMIVDYSEGCHVVGPSPGNGLLLHVWLTGCCSSSSPHPVSFKPLSYSVQSFNTTGDLQGSAFPSRFKTSILTVLA